MNGTYGIVKPTLINDINQDVEIWYRYMPTRTTNDETYNKFYKIDTPSSVLSSSKVTDGEIKNGDDVLPGMFNLSLPIDIFGRTGIYTVYIKPKEYFFNIKDVGALAAYPDVKGIVIDLNNIEDNKTLFANNNLIGYRIEYYDTNKRQEYYRIITSNNTCEPISQNLTSSNTNSNGYRFNDSGTLSFITVTPSTSPSFKANQTPFIGSPNQSICITNTKFDPISIEIEMVEHDIETLTTMIEGDQIRSLDKGLVTTYNSNGEIYHQSEFYTVKSDYTSNEMYEVRKKKTDNFDTSTDYDELVTNQ